MSGSASLPPHSTAKMFGNKVKTTALCIFGLLVLFHWLEAVKVEDEPENDENYLDVSRDERSIDDVTSVDAADLQANADIRSMRRRSFAYDRRRRTRRRRSGHRRRWWR